MPSTNHTALPAMVGATPSGSAPPSTNFTATGNTPHNSTNNPTIDTPRILPNSRLRGGTMASSTSLTRFDFSMARRSPPLSSTTARSGTARSRRPRRGLAAELTGSSSSTTVAVPAKMPDTSCDDTPASSSASRNAVTVMACCVKVTMSESADWAISRTGASPSTTATSRHCSQRRCGPCRRRRSTRSRSRNRTTAQTGRGWRRADRSRRRSPPQRPFARRSRHRRVRARRPAWCSAARGPWR